MNVACRSFFFSLFASFAVSIIQLEAAPPTDADCLQCHEDKTLAATNAAGVARSLFVDEAALRASIHKTNTCASCHADITAKHPDDGAKIRPVDCAACHARQSETYGASVHGLAARDGDASSPGCRDCHGTHNVLPPSNPQSPLSFGRLATTCGQCHEKESKEVQASVHGKAVARGQRESPTCIACHSEHQIEKLSGSSSAKISEQVCSKCHASEKINTKFKLPKDRVQTFFESYHGLASQYGSARAANCASCHGYHLVLPSNDPRSMISTNNLVKTCGACHPGAGENFSTGRIHLNGNAATAGDLGANINLWVKRVYLVLIFGTIGFMLLHNGLSWFRKFLRIWRSQSRPVLRMTANERWQHFLLLSSFILLAWTGFALKFPDSWIAKSLGSNEEIRRWTHRGAGVLMMVLGAYHVWYLAFTVRGRQLLRDFLPAVKDLKDFQWNAAWLLGRRKEHARIGRFGYAEKMEYWAVVWGTILMGATGLIIWFPVIIARWLPRWVIDVATTIHFYEAILACLAILVWHFYHVMFDPDIYPINPACLDGYVSEHWMKDEHPLDPDCPKPAKTGADAARPA